MFSVGAASLPEGGMGEVPKQIAADLPEGAVVRGKHFGANVGSISAMSELLSIHSAYNTAGK